ncbi:uncharacterized protein LOC121585913 [Coregonus clupeaformis]|uniref:uncharacterized protein LOC121585913 n=1 Tax=Coregonus clupeaformis TaxID=59861 RepID=UPI001E1C4AE9|nr:uncharacterized protein LOC121585913 [Coregonus clupeaformis]
MRRYFRKTSPVKTAVHTEEEPHIRATQADWNEGKSSQSQAKHHEAPVWAQTAKEQMKSALKPLESPANKEPTLTTAPQTPGSSNKAGWFNVLENQPRTKSARQSVRARQMTPDDSLFYFLENLHAQQVETIEDIVTRLIGEIYYDETGTQPDTPIPGLSETALDLIDNVVDELKNTPSGLFALHTDEPLVLPSSYKRQVAKSVHKELLSCTGSQESLWKAVSSGHMVKEIASSISQEVSKVTSKIGAIYHTNSVNHTDSPISPGPRTDTNASWVSCAASDISEDLVLRILDFISYCRSPDSTWNGPQSRCSTDMTGDLMDAVMVELFTNTAMLTTPEYEHQQQWGKPSLTDLEKAARLVYEKMVKETGSAEALQDALKLRRKLVVTALADVVAKQVYKHFSEQESDSTYLPDQTSHKDDCPVTSHSNRQLTPELAAVQSASECIVNCKAVWEIISRLLQEISPNVPMEEKRHLYAQDLFHCAINQLSESPGVTICADETICDVCRHPQVIELIRGRVLECLQFQMNLMGYNLSSALDAQDEALSYFIVAHLVQETLLLISSQTNGSSPEVDSGSHHQPESQTPLYVVSSKVNYEDWPTCQSKITVPKGHSTISATKGLSPRACLSTVSATKGLSQMPGQTPPYVVSSKVNYEEWPTWQSNITVSKGLSTISATKGLSPRACLSTVSATKGLSQMPGQTYTGKRGPTVLSVKIKKHSHRGIHITPSERIIRLKEMQRESSSEVSSVEMTSESHGHRRGGFGWFLSKLMCAEDIHWFE